LETERDLGIRGQKGEYSNVTGQPLVQVIAAVGSSGFIVEATHCRGGRASESDMSWGLDLWQRVNDEVDVPFHIHLILDRGFRDFNDALTKCARSHDWPYPNLTVTSEVVEHLGTKAEPHRLQHEPDEAQKNRRLQARRWINEKAFAFLKNAHFFDRVIEASALYHINSILRIAFALANMRMGCEPME
jgi:hypothetical protein